MKKLSFLLITFSSILFGVFSCTQAEFNKAMEAVNSAGGNNSSDVSDALKLALQIGIGNGSTLLSQPDGYYKSAYKILLPQEVQKITNKLKIIPGFNQVEETLVQKINKSAEDAAVSAKPIFVDAIKAMTFTDALNILMGADNAATNFLEKATRTQLYNKFNPVIIQSLNKFGALDYYKSAVDKYNSIPLVDKLNPRIDDYVTNKALDGLFSMVASEELKIRKNPAARVTDLLKRVFAKQDKK
jgi:hypothetical protein